ncbi:hypothetical protein PF001_g2708 [Phytophthora fragariae]|uniref:Uncharacterized protein n=1 Tax=Phytophthora fragariae TaxID=53985 RepID=A0A6A4ER82_9STRA|nr:hypothetical protein PF001_g2708 [Phytophthora fragariae]
MTMAMMSVSSEFPTTTSFSGELSPTTSFGLVPPPATSFSGSRSNSQLLPTTSVSEGFSSAREIATTEDRLAATRDTDGAMSIQLLQPRNGRYLGWISRFPECKSGVGVMIYGTLRISLSLMASSTFGVGSVVFLGPLQAPSLTEFHYARVVSVSGTAAQIALIDPDGVDEDPVETVDVAVLQRRRVDDAEKEM